MGHGLRIADALVRLPSSLFVLTLENECSRCSCTPFFPNIVTRHLADCSSLPKKVGHGPRIANALVRLHSSLFAFRFVGLLEWKTFRLPSILFAFGGGGRTQTQWKTKVGVILALRFPIIVSRPSADYGSPAEDGGPPFVAHGTRTANPLVRRFGWGSRVGLIWCPKSISIITRHDYCRLLRK